MHCAHFHNIPSFIKRCGADLSGGIGAAHRCPEIVQVNVTVPPLPPGVANPADINVKFAVAVYNTTAGEGPTSANCSSNRTRFRYASSCASAMFYLAESGLSEVLAGLLELSLSHHDPPESHDPESAFTGSFQCTSHDDSRTCIDHYRPPRPFDNSPGSRSFNSTTILPNAFELYCQSDPTRPNSWSLRSCFALG